MVLAAVGGTGVVSVLPNFIIINLTFRNRFSVLNASKIGLEEIRY